MAVHVFGPASTVVHVGDPAWTVAHVFRLSVP